MNVEDKDQYTRTPAPRLRPAFLMGLCLALGMSAGVILDRSVLLAVVPPTAVPDFRLMAEAWSLIQHYYVDRSAVKPKVLTYGAISGMVDALGDTGHSAFLTPSMVKQLSVVERGQLKGVGLEVEMRHKHLVIVAPIDNSPAQRAGLRSGEIILSVDGHAVTGQPLSQVVSRISGPPGTSVKLTVLNPKNHKIHSVSVVRAAIKLDDVSWHLLPGTSVADVRISSFDTGVAKDLRRTLRVIERKPVQGLILDLRNNPGGVLKEAVAVASQFLTHGNVLLTKNAQGKITSVPVKPGGLAPKIPMAVLINSGSASGAEIVAGALRDAHRATLIGEKTFGTGTVLNEFPLTDGSALMLAIQEWLTPDGQSFWHHGIPPQIKVALPAEVQPLIPATEHHLTPAALRSSKDTQLLRALQCVSDKIAAEPKQTDGDGKRKDQAVIGGGLTVRQKDGARK